MVAKKTSKSKPKSKSSGSSKKTSKKMSDEALKGVAGGLNFAKETFNPFQKQQPGGKTIRGGGTQGSQGG